jgi:hypothetical protein
MIFGFWLLLAICTAVIILSIGKFVDTNNLNILIAGIASILTAALFVKLEKREPTNGEKLLFSLVIAAVFFIFSAALNFRLIAAGFTIKISAPCASSSKDSAKASRLFAGFKGIISFFSARVLLYTPLKTFIEFSAVYVPFHFYAKNATKRQLNRQ